MRSSVAVAVACLSMTGLSLAGQAEAAIRKSTNIGAQGLAPALQVLAKERDIQLVYRSDVVSNRQTSGAVGELTLEEALIELLSGTGLTFQYLEDKGITIVPIADDAGQPSSSSSSLSGGGKVAESKKSFWTRLRLAQAELPSVPQAAAPQSPNTSALEEVIVTAQKREQSLLEVPMSIAALRGEDLETQSVRDLADLAIAVPGVSIWDTGGYGPRQIFMRGVGNTRGTGSLVGLYLDESSVTGTNSSAVDLKIFDLDRIEVLRGPQGTLYGEGSMGGTIRFITKDPELDRFSGKSELSGTHTESGSWGQMARGVLNLPIVDGKFAVRTAVTYENTSGWIDQGAVNREDINDEEIVNARVKGLWQATDALKVVGTFIVHRNDAGALDTGEETAGGDYRQVLGRPTTPSGKHDYDFYNLTVDYDFGSVGLVSTTSYLDALSRHLEFGYRLPLFAARPATPIDVLLGTQGDSYDRDSKVLTHETRLSSSGDSSLNWTVGVFYRDLEERLEGARRFGLPTAPSTPLPIASEVTSRSWSGFGQVSYELSPRLEVGAGLSYFEDERKEANLLNNTALSGPFDSVNPRFFVSYGVADNTRIYASAAKGFRSGGFNAGGLAAGRPPYEPDSIWSYELGAKSSLLEGRLSAEVALFFSEYSDLQIDSVQFLPNGGIAQFTTNSGNAEIKGVDLNLSYRASGGLSLGVSGDYVDTEMVEINALSASHRVGDPLDQIPRYHLTVWTSYDFHWLASMPGHVRLDYNQQGESEIRNRTVGPWYHSSSDVINMLNAVVGWQRDRWFVDLFAQNLLNDRGYLSADWGQQYAPRARPRTYGIRVGVDF